LKARMGWQLIPWYTMTDGFDADFGVDEWHGTNAFIRTASLDDPSWFNPQVDVWTSDAHPWDQMNPALPKFEKYPPSGDSAGPAAS